MIVFCSLFVERKIAMEKSVDNIKIYEKIKADKNPIFIWGTGALARDVYKYCKHFNIEITGFFINEGEKMYTFENHDVYSFEELNKFGKTSVIIGHHHYKMGKEFLMNIPYVENIYFLSMVSYEMWDEVDVKELECKHCEWENVYRNLSDDFSRDCLRSFLEARLYNDSEKMFPYYNEKGYYEQDVLKLSDKEIFLDIGACVGNTIWPFVDAVSGKYKKIIALEPEKRNYEQLCLTIKERMLENIITMQTCAWKRTGIVNFCGDGELGGITEKNIDNSSELPAIAIDDLQEKITLIKINFPFSIADILDGGAALLKTEKPKLIIRTGFKESLILETCNKVKEINQEYHIFFRYTLGMPQGLTLYAI